MKILLVCCVVIWWETGLLDYNARLIYWIIITLIIVCGEVNLWVRVTLYIAQRIHVYTCTCIYRKP